MNNNAAKKLDAESAEQPKTSLEVVKKDEKEVAEVPSLGKRIQKVEDLSILIEKWRKLTDTRRNLQTFSLGTDGMGATVFLRDASGILTCRAYKWHVNKICQASLLKNKSSIFALTQCALQ